MSGHLLVYSLKEIKNTIVLSSCAFLMLGCFSVGGEVPVMQSLKGFEMFLLPFAGCWTICSFWDYVAPDVREVFLSYPKSRILMGIGKSFYIAAVYFALYSLLCFCVFGKSEGVYIYYIGMCSEIFFWIFFGFFLIMRFQNIIVSISIIWTYTAIQILDVEGYFEKLSIYTYNCNSIEGILGKGCILILLGSFFMIKGQKTLDKLYLNSMD